MSKTYLVTSALPYANGDIHLGHLVEHVQTDIFVRFQKLMGHQCYYMCADDAHGTAIMLSAEKEGVEPEEFIDQVKAQHIRDFERFNIAYDHYYSTHSDENRQLSEVIYGAAQSDGGIIKKDIQQYFDEEKGLFLSDRYIKGTCPKCGAEDQYGDACEKCYATYSATDLVNPVSIFSGKPPVLKASTHYFFNLEKYRKHITNWLDQDAVSQSIKNKLNEWLDGELKPWDISRDAPYFGFKIPGTEDKYFYVWLDAPIGYIATTESWAQKKNESHEQYWKNENVEIHHFIGKDIMYFHTLFWPAMLAVSGFNQPTKVHVHGFLTVNGEKMSKSRGTFILARDYAEQLDPDILRYYYAAKLSSSMEDIDFSVEDFVHRVNADVLGKYINIASRIGAIITKKLDGRLSSINDEGHAVLQKMVDEAINIQRQYRALETNKCMRLIMECAEMANKYIDEKAPWSMINNDEARVVCTVALNALRILTIYLSPVLPAISSKLFSYLGVPSQSFNDLTNHLVDVEIQPYAHVLQRLKLEDVATLITPNS